METIVQKHCDDAQSFFKKLALQLGAPEDIQQAMRLTRAVMHAIRNRITPEESMHLVSQHPLLLKGIYIDGWNISQPLSDSRTMDEFLLDLQRTQPRGGTDFTDIETAKNKIRTVFNALRQYVDDGEYRHLITELPKEIADALR